MENIRQAFNFNLWPLLTVAVFGLICYLIIGLLKRIVFAKTGSVPWIIGIKDKWAVMERVFWALFALVALGVLIAHNPMVGTIIAFLLLATTWTFIRNYVAGILVLAEGAIKTGQSIRFDKYEGKVVRLGALNCDVELDDSGKETLKIPYSTLASQLVVKTSPSENVVSHISVLEVDKSHDPVFIEGQIESTLLNMPWLVAEEGYTIERIEDEGNQYRFRVVLRGIDKKQLRRGTEVLRTFLEPAV